MQKIVFTFHISAALMGVIDCSFKVQAQEPLTSAITAPCRSSIEFWVSRGTGTQE